MTNPPWLPEDVTISQSGPDEDDSCNSEEADQVVEIADAQTVPILVNILQLVIAKRRSDEEDRANSRSQSPKDHSFDLERYSD